MRTIEVTESTFRAIELAARLTGMSLGGVVERLVAQSASPSPTKESPAPDDAVKVYAAYNGRRVTGDFSPIAKGITITSGPLIGEYHKTPSSAARAVIKSERPDVDPNRNGWTFWLLDDGTERPLQAIR